MTEKVFQALKVGAIPVMWGTVNRNLLPVPDAGIFLEDFGNDVERMMQYVAEVVKSKALYEKHTAWKFMDPSQWAPAFRDSLEQRFSNIVCRLAEWYVGEKKKKLQ